LFESFVGFGEYYPIRFTVNNAISTNCSINLTDADLGGGSANPIVADSYYASNKVSCSGKVDIAKSVSFSAGNIVELNAGFEVEKGGFFIAETEGCFE